MKLHFLPIVAASLLTGCLSPLSLEAQSKRAFVYETPQEFFGSGDFDGDGRTDLVIVDKASGKFRLGYQTPAGRFNWADCRPSGLKGINGFDVGRLLSNKSDAFAFAAADANQIILLDAPAPEAAGKRLPVPFNAALGPSTIVGVDGGSLAKNGLLDLFVGSIYNSPDPNLGTLLRNDGSQFPRISEATLPGAAAHGNRLGLKTGQPEVLCVLLEGDKKDTFVAESFASGKAVPVLTVPGLPTGSEYALGDFGGAPLRQLLFYKPGEPKLTLRSLQEASPGRFSAGAETSFDLAQPLRRVITLELNDGPKLLVLFGNGQSAGLFNFDGAHAPAPVQTFTATNEVFTCAASSPKGIIFFSEPVGAKFSTRYYVYEPAGARYAFGAFGSLPSLADNDNMTIPQIRARILSKLTVTNPADMKLYTNTIPGTQVRYVMVPIPGGTFLMGSPDSEPGHKPDESPQHEVKLAPFWMGRCEITWNEYELFMYSDEEKQMRAMYPTDPAGDKLADAVTHPSKPYVEMSFGMGKDGYPAISMTQHGANKYCQWLSAKTGQFYRLPTEAEWEYACRAGTTTMYSFGNDPSKLGDYAWYEDNSDFKYQKVGKKKPNPWGLYDMYGNVMEWVLDQYDPGFYKLCATNQVTFEPWNKATKPYPHAVRGGSWNDPANMCRSAARLGSDPSWKMTDPQLPKSIWYLSDAQWVGFRLVRPLKVPSAEEMQKYWNSGTERD
jgi:formylglycine-generating enzyme required for sulfatase activity